MVITLEIIIQNSTHFSQKLRHIYKLRVFSYRFHLLTSILRSSPCDTFSRKRLIFIQMVLIGTLFISCIKNNLCTFLTDIKLNIICSFFSLYNRFDIDHNVLSVTFCVSDDIQHLLYRLVLQWIRSATSRCCFIKGKPV